VQGHGLCFIFAERVRRPSGRTDLGLLITTSFMAFARTSVPVAGLLRACETNHHALHDQYLAFVFGPGFAQL